MCKHCVHLHAAAETVRAKLGHNNNPLVGGVANFNEMSVLFCKMEINRSDHM